MKKKNESNDERIIPKKNYAKVSVMFIATIIIVTFCFVFYNSYSKEVIKIPVIRGTIAEIEEKDLEGYVTENDDFLLYIGVADNQNCRELEEKLKDVLKERDLLDTIYLNITNVSSKEEFYNTFNSKYSPNIKLSSYPAFIIVSDKQVMDLVQGNDETLRIDDIEKLLDEYEIIGGTK